ncbi:MAG TPA: glycosyltransferase family 4 protein [Planctomycetota bacterium]|nr:glycosyltransferase family 4 protein [Planctomycetota bacterium]
MNVVLLTNVEGNGGSAATLFHNALILRKRGWTPTFFAPGDYWKSRGAAEGVSVVNTLELRRGFHAWSLMKDFFALRRFVMEHDTDAIIVQKSPEQWLAALVLYSIPWHIALIRMRGVVFEIQPSLFNRKLHNRMDAVICSASVIAEQFRAMPGFKQEHVSVLLEGIDAEYFTPTTPERRTAARLRWELNQNALIVGTAGRPSPVKGHEILVRAFAMAMADSAAFQHQNMRLAIFADESRRGKGSYKNLGDMARSLGIRERIDLVPGYVEDMRLVYHALDAYILPSLGSEGSSRAALEASACGLPLIASRVGVLPDLIKDNKSGLLVPPGNVEALAAKLTELALTWPRYKFYGESARARILRRFTEAQYADKLCDVVRSAVVRQGAAIATPAVKLEDQPDSTLF